MASTDNSLVKVLFVHDGPIYTTNDGKYYGIHYTNTLVERYGYFGDTVTFMMRSQSMPQGFNGNYSVIDHPKFDFIDIPDFKSIRKAIHLAEAKRMIKEGVESQDVVIVRLPSAIGTIAYWHAARLKKPVLVEVVACVFDALWNYDWRGKLLAHYKMAAYRRLLRSTSHAMYVTQSFLQKRYPSYGKQIGCSDVVVRIDEQILSDRISKILHRGEAPLTLGTVAALDVPYKGQADVIRAIYLLKKQGILVYYHLVGQGSPLRLKKLVEKLGLSSQVKLIGPLAHHAVFDFYEQLDVYVQPSKVEGLPRAIIEAMSRACPVLASKIGGIPELLQGKVMFEVGNVTKIAGLIQSLTPKTLEEQARINFEMSKNYVQETLDKRRAAFYREFMEDFHLK